MATIQIHVTPPQGKIMSCNKRFRVVNAGRRFGKSYLAGYEMLTMCINKPGAVVWYVAPSLPTARKVMWNGWIKAVDQTTGIKHIPEQYIKKMNEQMMTIEFKNGSMLYLLSASEPDNLRGSGVDLIVFDEAAFMPDGTWEIIRPTLSDRYHAGKALFISTPSGFNWFYDLYNRCKDKHYRDSWECFQFTTLEGGNVTKEELEEARRTMSAKMFNQEYMASFETLSNRIYYNYNRDENSVLEEDCEDWFGKSGDIHVGIDFNVNPMTAAIFAECKDHNGRKISICFNEIVEPNSDTQHLCETLKRKYRNCDIYAYPDPTCRKRQTNGVAGRTDKDIIENNGIHVRVPHAPYATKDKFNTVNTALENAKGEHSIFIVREDCPQLTKAWEGYTYNKNGEPDKTSGLDHISDAAAYYINYQFPAKSKRIRRPQLLGV